MHRFPKKYHFQEIIQIKIQKWHYSGMLVGEFVVNPGEIESSFNLRLKEIRADMGKPRWNWTRANLVAVETFAKWKCCVKPNPDNMALAKGAMLCCPPGKIGIVSRRKSR